MKTVRDAKENLTVRQAVGFVAFMFGFSTNDWIGWAIGFIGLIVILKEAREYELKQEDNL